MASRCRTVNFSLPGDLEPGRASEAIRATDPHTVSLITFAGKLQVILIRKPSLSRNIATIDIAEEFAVSPVSNIAGN